MATISPVSSNPVAPIQRLPASDRLANFAANSNAIYTEFSPYGDSNDSNQPYIYTFISDSESSKDLTQADTRDFPFGSTVRDVERMGNYLSSGRGMLFLSKQSTLQGMNAFNETRVYNPLGVVEAAARLGSDAEGAYPIRHLDTGGGLINMLLSAVGMQSQGAEQPTIQGTATGGVSDYAGDAGSAKYGLIRFETGQSAISRFSSLWLGNGPSSGGGFLDSLASTLVNKLATSILGTNPLGASIDNPNGTSWEYRPEYPAGGIGAYYQFMSDGAGFFTTTATVPPVMYNDGYSGPTSTAAATATFPVSYYHKYTPKVPYASPMLNNPGQKTYEGTPDTTIESLAKILGTQTNALIPETPAQYLRSAERYSTVTDSNFPKSSAGVGTSIGKTTYQPYQKIPSTQNQLAKFYLGLSQQPGAYVLESDRGFANSSGSANGGTDTYNSLSSGSVTGPRPTKNVASALTAQYDSSQSKDVIFFYFYDLINQVYIPFRATVSGISDQNTADWEEVAYMGRADKLYVYKGFTRDMNIAFTVYANSINELVPMWSRINYLVGLTRPSKYTALPTPINNNVKASTGIQSQFIYPPMVTLRLGDMFNDQPCVISNVTVNIPDDTPWETLRADDQYTYLFGPNGSNISSIIVNGVQSRQLPLKVDLSVSMKLMEKGQSMTSADHYGHNMPL
jgi:hypothetical protein